jgi:hypothetical protein
MQVPTTAPAPSLSPQVLMAAALLGAEASTAPSWASAQSWGGVGALLLRFLEYFSGTSPDALHAVVVDSESRLQAKQLSRLKLLAEHLAPPASPSAVPSTPPAVPDDEPSQGRAHHGASHGRGGGASNGRGAHHGVTSRGPYEEAVYAAASLLVQEPR